MQDLRRLRVLAFAAVFSVMTAPAGLMAQAGATDGGNGAAAGSDGQGATDSAEKLPPPKPMEFLRAVPADATAFFSVGPMSTLDQDIRDVAARLGFPMGGQQGFFPAPLEMMKQHLNVSAGLNDNGTMGMVLLNCSQLQSSAELMTRSVILVPTVDAEALMSGWMPTKEGEQTTVNFMGMPAFAAERDGFVLLAQTPGALEEAMKAKGPGLARGFSRDCVGLYRENDVFFYGNFRELSQEIRDEVIAMMTGAMMMADPAATDPRGGMASQIDAVRQLLHESRELAFGMDLSVKKGLSMTGYWRAQPDTELAKMVEANEGTTEPLLVGLADEPVLMTFGGTAGFNEVIEEKVRTQAVSSIQALDAADGDPILTDEQINGLVDNYVKLLADLKQLSFSIAGVPQVPATDPAAAEPEPLPTDLVKMTLVAKVEESQAFRSNIKKLYETGKAILLEAIEEGYESGGGDSAEAAAENPVPKVSAAIRWQESAEQVEGASVDHLVVDLKEMPGVSEGDISEFKRLFGEQGLFVRIATVGDEHVIVSFGGDKERFQKIVATTEEGGSPLSKRAEIVKVQDRLPEGERTVVGYFNVDELLKVIMAASNALGQPIPFPLAMQNAAPLAVTQLNLGDGASRVDFLVPMELVDSGYEMVKPMIAMFMMGGGMGGEMGGPMGGPMDDMGEPGPSEPADDGEMK